jgi:type 1 fimbriae regulatory protein FimB
MTTATGNTAVDPRSKNYLSEPEMTLLLAAAKRGRHGARDYAMVLLAYRHGLRVSELINLAVTDVDLGTGRLNVQRSKGSLSTEQPMQADEIRAVKAWQREHNKATPFLFYSERGPFTRQAFNYLCETIGRRAGLGVKVHPHMLRHSCGFALANKGTDTRLIQDWLGHRDLRHTALYTRTSAKRFEGVWK